MRISPFKPARFSAVALVATALTLSACSDDSADSAASSDVTSATITAEAAEASEAATEESASNVQHAPRTTTRGTSPDSRLLGVQTDEGTMATRIDVAKGECMNQLINQESYDPVTQEYQVADVVPVDCDDEHDLEVYATTPMELDGGQYPGAETVMAQAHEFCAAEFATFVGVEHTDSKYDYAFYYPTPEGYEYLDDKDIKCFAGLVGGKIETGSIKDSNA